MRLFRLTYLLLLLLGLATKVMALPGSLSGSVELRYAQHTAEEAGAEVLDAYHFTQSYSLLWENQGKIKKGRFGKYDIALGYQWNWLSSEVNGAKVAVDNPLDKILFRGDVDIAPGGLPFRLYAYSRDMNAVSFAYQELGELFVGQENFNQPGLIDSVRNGTSIETGLTLMAGVKNGRYEGMYRDVFNSMPRIFIDFKQVVVDDTSGTEDLRYTDRNLAFVSLNKNKNWFHYRMFTHEDEVDESNDYERKTVLLGTIDHVNRRQWIDLTNWIKLSTDISYSETTPNPSASETFQKRYDVNLFATAERRYWRGGAFPSYSRVRDKNSLEKSIDMPLVVNGHLQRGTRWRLRMENRQEDDLTTDGRDSNRRNHYLAGRLELFPQSRYQVSPLLEIETKEGTESGGEALRLGAEVYSNQRYHSASRAFASYSLTLFRERTTENEDSSYFEQQLLGRYSKGLTRELQTGIEQKLVYGRGGYQGDGTDYIDADYSVLSSELESSGPTSGSYFRTVTTAYLDYRPLSRIYQRAELEYDYIDSPVGTGGQLTLTHNLNYYGRTLSAAVDSELIIGSDLHDSFSSDADVVGGTTIVRQGGTVEASFESLARFDYDPDRVHHNSLDLEAEFRRFEAGGSDQRYKLTQEYSYSFWKSRGLLRKLAIVGEEFEYENYTPSFGSDSSLLSFSLFSELYPTRQTLLKVRLRYETDTVAETDTLYAFLTAGVDFQKFQVDFDYAYGTRTAGISQPERVEHKWEMKVRKTF